MKRGSIVIVDLHSPNEKYWGALLKLSPAGIWLRGLSLEAFDDWVRQVARDGLEVVGVITAFFPMSRVARITMDENMGRIPSYAERFRHRVGKDPTSFLLPARGGRA